MKPVSLVVTDLDGTLWDGDEAIHETTLGALDEVAGRGVPLLVATGRRSRSARRGLAAAGLTPPSVLLGGALGVDFATGQEFHRTAFASEDARRVLEVFLDHGLDPVVYVEEATAEVVIGDACATHPEHLARFSGGVERGDTREAVASRAVLSFGLIGADPDVLTAIARDVGDEGVAIVNRDLYYDGATLMVSPRGITKWDGVLAFCRMRGLDPEAVLAIGDGMNDVAMLGQAMLACVVADGEAEALAVADHVIPPTIDGGWAEILQFLPD